MKIIKWIILLACLFCTSPIFTATCGDVNSDNSIDIVDALLVAQDYVGDGILSKDIADVDNSDSVDIVDALLLAQFYVGILTKLPGCGPTIIEPTEEPTKEPGTEPKNGSDSLFAYWNFDEPGENDICKDSSGNGYDGTPSGPVPRGPGKVGDHCITLGHEKVINPPKDMPFPTYPVTYSAWVKADSLEGRQYIITYPPNTEESHHEYEFAFFLERAEIRFWIWGHVDKSARKEKFGIVAPIPAKANEWMHLTVTIGEPTGVSSKPSLKEGAVDLTYTMYINGESAVSRIVSFPPFQEVGEYAIGGKPWNEFTMNGNIDELMIFSKALTAEEVMQLYTTNSISPISE